MRRIAIAAAATCALCLLALAGGWFLAARHVKAEIAGWTDRQRAGGVFFSHGEIGVGGFPFRIDLMIPEPALASADGRRRWEGPAIHATAPLWQAGTLDYEAPGRHRYRFTGSDGSSREIILDMLAATGSVAFDANRIRLAALAAEKVRISGTAPGEVLLESLGAELLLEPEHGADLKSESGKLALSARSIAFQGEGGSRASAEPIQSLDLQIALTGPLPWGETPDALARWRDAGGTVELRRVALAWSTLGVDGDGTLALDQDMRPQGAVTLRISGLQPTLQKLTAEGVLAPEDAELIQRIASDLASPDVDDPGRVLIAVSAQGGRLTVRERTYRILHPITAP